MSAALRNAMGITSYMSMEAFVLSSAYARRDAASMSHAH